MFAVRLQVSRTESKVLSPSLSAIATANGHVAPGTHLPRDLTAAGSEALAAAADSVVAALEAEVGELRAALETAEGERERLKGQLVRLKAQMMAEQEEEEDKVRGRWGDDCLWGIFMDTMVCCT